jgi:hemerythrin-like domain-containing protein
MDTSSAYFTDDHRRCDDAWAEIEGFVVSKDLTAANQAWERFSAMMRRHLAMEEEVLFPALEDAMGMHGGGPTHVMRLEHAQMRGLLDQMGQCAAAGQFDQLLDHGDTLLMIIQQHNAKEEGILYRMADRALGDAWPELQAKLRAF